MNLNFRAPKQNFLPNHIPTLKTLETTFHSLPFTKIPVVFIKSTKNNTILTCTDFTMKKIILTRSCGHEGFKNCMKSTGVAAQTTAIALAKVLMKVSWF